MSAAVLFRGHAYRPIRDGFSGRDWGVDWRVCVESHRRFLIDPLREQYGTVDVFLCFYSTDRDADVLRDYAPAEWCHGEAGASQRQTFLRGLRLVTAGHAVVATCRFDIELLSAPTLHPGFDQTKVNFLFREWKEECWKDRRVADCMHVLPGDLIDGFAAGVTETPSEICLHTVYRPVERHVGAARMNVILGEAVHDSNTDMPGVPNPFYKMRRVL